jgi:subtilase family serine protease
MRSARSWVALAAAGLAVSAATAALGAPAASAAGAHHQTSARASASAKPAKNKSLAAPAARSHPDGSVSRHSQVHFQLSLKLQHPKQAAAFAMNVSRPGSAVYHHYITGKQWMRRYGPTKSAARTAKAWLTQHGFTVKGTSAARLHVSAHASASKVEKAFRTKLGMYKVNGNRVRLASKAIRLPSALKRVATGTVGVNQYVETPALPEPPHPAAFRNPEPCSDYWGQKQDTTDSASLYAPYTSNDYDICGYQPGQLRSAYSIPANAGTGQTIAIVDAYDSPTLGTDAAKYFHLNDPNNPITTTNFKNSQPSDPANEEECGASGWYAEQALDVEAEHTMAPGATIQYEGTNDCLNQELIGGDLRAVQDGANIVSNSWGDAEGDLLEDQNAKNASDEVFEYAASQGVSVLFSSGDDGDNFADFGIAAPDYPASSPFVTAVGGTSLEIDQSGNDINNFGWSTATQTLCANEPTPDCAGATTPTQSSVTFQGGGGGGTSYTYLQPSYQAGVVPNSLATKNSALFGSTPTRVEPDISMDADAQTGMLIGLTQRFPAADGGTRYGQFKEGGTSLASPLFAGELADANSISGTEIGFANPTLYADYTSTPGAYQDIVFPADPNSADTIRVNYVNSVDATDGYNIILRDFDYEGPETNCNGAGNCETRNVTLNTAPGFDSMTGLGSPGASFLSLFVPTAGAKK